MTPMEIGAILGSVLLTLIGVVWGMLRSDIAELKARVTSAEKENARLVTEHARSEERDKAFEGGIERLTKAIDDFDTRIGKQIDNLSRVVEELTRRHTPPGGYKFIGGTLDKKKKDEGE